MTGTSGLCFAQFFARLILITFAVFIPVYACAGSKNKPGKPLPPALIGTWQVTKVTYDSGATRRRNYQYNDPRLKGRMLVATSNKMTFDDDSGTECISPTVTVKRTTAAALIKESMGWRGFDPQIPTPKNFVLPIANNTLIDVMWVNCKKGNFGPDAGDISDNTWILPLPTNGQLAVRWFDDTLLFLNRMAANEKTKASFNCASAGNTSEKTICRSIALGSLDISIAESYSNAIRFFREGSDPKGLNKLKTAQKKWLVKRNSCGSNEACLKKSMLTQLEVLADPQQFSPD